MSSTIAKSYKNFNDIKWRSEESQNIDKIWNWLEDNLPSMNLPDTTMEFMVKVQKRLENEQNKVDKQVKELWAKEQKAIAKRNRKIKRQKHTH
jgi:hypothetical protein